MSVRKLTMAPFVIRNASAYYGGDTIPLREWGGRHAQSSAMARRWYKLAGLINKYI